MKKIFAKLNDKFEGIADKVSFGIGTPLNFGFWIFVVAVWFVVFGAGIVSSNATFMPTWFTSTAFNFPLNTVTTLMELYIGFLLAAAANRAQKALEKLIKNMYDLVQNIEHMMAEQDKILAFLAKSQKEELEQETAELEEENEILEILKRMESKKK